MTTNHPATIDQKPPATELSSGEQLHAFFAQIVKDKYLAPWADTLESHKDGWNAIAARIAEIEAELAEAVPLLRLPVRWKIEAFLARLDAGKGGDDER